MGSRQMRSTGVVVSIALMIAGNVFLSAPTAAEDLNGIVQSSDYFPDTVGSHWEYRGQITEGPLQTIEHKFFSNVSSVTGTKSHQGHDGHRVSR